MVRTQMFEEGYEAVKIIGGKEVDWIDPLFSVSLTEEELVINNGAHDYDFPAQEYECWTFRKMTTD